MTGPPGVSPDAGRDEGGGAGDPAGLPAELAAHEAALRRQLVRVTIGLAGGLAALAVVILAVTRASGDASRGGQKAGPGDFPHGIRIPAQRFDMRAAAEAARCRLVNPPDEGDEHVGSPVRYRANPPTSGDHRPTAADDGAYVKSPPPEATVHALEHGRVFIQFRPDASERIRGQLFTLFDEDRHHMLLGPNVTGMRPQVAATAWNHALLCPRMNDRVFDAIRAFRDRYRNRGPELVE